MSKQLHGSSRRWCSTCRRWEVDAGPPLGWVRCDEREEEREREERERRRFLRTFARLAHREVL